MHKQVEKYQEELNRLKKADNYRHLETRCTHMINLSSNDYLGLAKREDIKQEFIETEKQLPGFSAVSSRLLTGNHQYYNNLENLIQQQFKQEAALVFNSGYHANIGVLPTLAGPKDLVIADKLVHASLIDGIKLSSADFMRYRHLDYQHLEQILEKNRKQYQNTFIVTETLFSMDGDMADLHKLVEIKNKFKTMLYIDEAHAYGVYGATGLGRAEQEGLIPDIDFIVGTFGKALASVGAFVTCKQVIKKYLINKSRPLIFTTAIPPINTAWTYHLVKKLPHLHNERQHLKSISKQLAETLGKKMQSHIIPLIVGENNTALKISGLLEKENIIALPIRHPAVPKGTARIRFSLNASHSSKQIVYLTNTLKTINAKNPDQNLAKI